MFQYITFKIYSDYLLDYKLLEKSRVFFVKYQNVYLDPTWFFI